MVSRDGNHRGIARFSKNVKSLGRETVRRGKPEKENRVMNNKPGLGRPRVSRSLPHPSWNLDRPILFSSHEPAADERHSSARRKVTPEEIWAVVDAAN